MANVPVKDTPFGSGKAPTKAPSQTEALTAFGATGQGSDSHPIPAPRVAPPVGKGTTGPKIASPSVDYNTQQGNRIKKGGSGSVDYSGEQAQQLQDKGGA